MSQNPLYVAMGQIGTMEIKGSKNNPTILTYAKESGFDWVNNDETPWCSIFMNWCCLKADLQRSNAADARSWLNIGIPVATPEPGDVVIFWRVDIDSWQGHVGFFLGYDLKGGRVFCLGGNQDDQVSITAYPAHQVLGFRRLKTAGAFKLPAPPLQAGDSGTKVRELQDGLKLASYDCGTSDGIFGSRTQSAVRLLQSTSKATYINGVYDKPTKQLLEDILLQRNCTETDKKLS